MLLRSAYMSRRSWAIMIVIGVYFTPWTASGADLTLGSDAMSAPRPREISNGVERGVSIAERRRPDYDPVPLPLGNGSGEPLDGFDIVSSVGLEQAYDSNIHRASSGARGDLISVLKPALSLASDRNNHALSLSADGEVGRYWASPRDDYQDLKLLADGRLDVARGAFVVGDALVRWLHDDRGSPDDIAGIRPTTYRLMGGDIGGRIGAGILGLRLLGSARQYRYDDSPTSAGPVSNRQRDRDEFYAGARLEYAYSANAPLFLDVDADRRLYRQFRDDQGYARGSNGGSVALGTGLDFGGLVTGEIFAGYTWRTYQDARLLAVATPLFGGRMLWGVTALTSVRLTFDRSVEETTLDPASADVSSRLSLAVEHELLRNLILSARLSMNVADYVGLSRVDTYREIACEGLYLMDRGLYIDGGLAYKTRRSTAMGADYDATVVHFGVVANF